MWLVLILVRCSKKSQCCPLGSLDLKALFKPTELCLQLGRQMCGFIPSQGHQLEDGTQGSLPWASAGPVILSQLLSWPLVLLHQFSHQCLNPCSPGHLPPALSLVSTSYPADGRA